MEMHGKYLIRGAFFAAIAAFAGSVSPAFAVQGNVSDEDFQVRNTSQLLDLCTASTTDPHYGAAIHFCHGYLVGAFQFRREEHASGKQSMSCMPNPKMSRNEAIQAYVSWAQAHPEYSGEPAADSFARYLDIHAPCHG